VILVRDQGELFALGATCTHYSGNLGDGICGEGLVRCPLHHGCFDLRTGIARGPALDPVPTYELKRDGDRVTVTAQRPRARPAPHAGPASVVVVGVGPAGTAAAETFRQMGWGGALTLIGAEPTDPVDRPNLSKDYLAGTAPEEWLPLRGQDFLSGLGELVLDDRVVTLDATTRTITLASGRRISAEAILLATGSEPLRLPIPGADLPHVFTLRSRPDAKAIVARLGDTRKAVVIGASFIGLEVAASLRTRGIAVTVVAPESLPLARIVGDEVGRFVLGLHQQKGVQFRLGRKPGRIGTDRVELDDGSTIDADLVVMGVGVRPRVQLAQDAGLKVDRGIVVDRSFRTSASGVYACGDAARYPDPRSGELIRIEHWAAAQRQGRAAALQMLSIPGEFRDVPFFWSQHYDVTLKYVGHVEKWDTIQVAGSLEKGDAQVLYRVAGRVMALVTVGRDRLSLEAEAAMQANQDDRLEALLRG
jgi:NADPH-dependent 2,4-dienoyl-CoA reductase/sulfur reductase-like enzyme/nitrite reductase/ring-hydroxylating ferredoxin subunit